MLNDNELTLQEYRSEQSRKLALAMWQGDRRKALLTLCPKQVTRYQPKEKTQ